MKTSLLYGLSSSLLLASSLAVAAEQTTTRTVTVDLGAASTITVISGGSAQTVTPALSVNADGTKTIPVTSLAGVNFSATGAFACVIRATSTNLVGTKFALAKELATDVGESLIYELNTNTGLSGEFGTAKTGTGAAISGSTLAGTTFIGGPLTITDNDTFLGIEASKSGTSTGTCSINMSTIQARNFKTSDTNSTSIPSTWKGKRTGVLTLTMSAL